MDQGHRGAERKDTADAVGVQRSFQDTIRSRLNVSLSPRPLVLGPKKRPGGAPSVRKVPGAAFVTSEILWICVLNRDDVCHADFVCFRLPGQTIPFSDYAHGSSLTGVRMSESRYCSHNHHVPSPFRRKSTGRGLSAPPERINI